MLPFHIFQLKNYSFCKFETLSLTLRFSIFPLVPPISSLLLFIFTICMHQMRFHEWSISLCTLSFSPDLSSALTGWKLKSKSISSLFHTLHRTLSEMRSELIKLRETYKKREEFIRIRKYFRILTGDQRIFFVWKFINGFGLYNVIEEKLRISYLSLIRVHKCCVKHIPLSDEKWKTQPAIRESVQNEE